MQSQEYILNEETGRIIGTGIEVHKILGAGFLEIVYKDALEYEFLSNNIFFEREKEYQVVYKNTVLRHKFMQTSLCLIK